MRLIAILVFVVELRGLFSGVSIIANKLMFKFNDALKKITERVCH